MKISLEHRQRKLGGAPLKRETGDPSIVSQRNQFPTSTTKLTLHGRKNTFDSLHKRKTLKTSDFTTDSVYLLL